MAITKFRSFWDITLDSGGGTDAPNNALLTPDTTNFQPPDIARQLQVLQSGKYFRERILGPLEDMQCTVTMQSNFHQLAKIGEVYHFDVEEELIDNDGGSKVICLYSVRGKLQMRSMGQLSHGDQGRQSTYTYIVEEYIEKHSDQSSNTYQIDLRANPPIIKQHGKNMFETQ